MKTPQRTLSVHHSRLTKGGIAVLLMLVGQACSGSKALTLHEVEPRTSAITAATDLAITIDGTPSEWDLDATIVQRNQDFNIHAQTDQEHLYLYVEILNPFFNRAIRNSGFTVYLSPDPKNRKARGVTFPIGAFNLLRDNPGYYQDFLRDKEWFQSPANADYLVELHRKIFNDVMLTEQKEPKARAYTGNLPLSMIESEGTFVTADTSRRVTSFEWAIPMDGSAPFQIRGGELHLGFSIDPPRFNYPDESGNSVVGSPYDVGYGGYGGYGYGGYGYGGYGGYGRRRSAPPRSQSMTMRRALGEFETWFVIRTE